MRILVFQHLAVEHPGTFRDFWQAEGHSWDAVELDEGQTIPPLEDYDVLAVMGGPMDVWQEAELPWLADEKAAMRRWILDLEKPCLGICLGHQLLAEVVGGKVGSMRQPEVGVSEIELTAAGRSDPLFSGLPQGSEVVQWHGAEVKGLPDGAEILAGNSACRIQAFRWGRFAYGLQYHVEVTPTTVADWVEIPAYRTSLESALGVDGAARLERDVGSRLDAMRTAAQQINDNFMGLLKDWSE